MIPNQTQRWNADLSFLIAFLINGRGMANICSKEFADAQKKGPPIAPLVVPKIGAKPWTHPPLSSHERACKYRRESVATKLKDSSHTASLQAWFLYTRSFISPAT